MSRNDSPLSPLPPIPPPRRRSTWQLIGAIVSVLAVVFGVAIVAFFILLVISFSSYGSSK